MLGHFANDIYSNFLPAYLPHLISRFALSLAWAGAASSVFTIVSSFTQLLFGYAGDRLRMPRYFLAAPLVTAIFMSAVGGMPSYLLVLCVLFFAALGTAAFHPGAASLAGEVSQRGRGVSISLFSAAGSLGFALGPVLATGFISLAGFGRTYLLAIPGLLLAAILIRKVRLPKGLLESAALKFWPSISPLLPLWLIVVLRHTVQLAFATFLIVFLEERGLSRMSGSLVLMVIILMGTAGTLLGGYLSDRLGRKAITTISLFLAYPLYLGFLNTSGLVSFAFLAGAGLSNAASNPVIIAQAQELAPGHAGTASAMTMGFAWGIAGLLISLVGLMGDLWGLAASFRWTILALPLAAAIALVTREKIK